MSEWLEDAKMTGFYVEKPRSNPDEDVSSSTDDSENRAIDTDNKKPTELFFYNKLRKKICKTKMEGRFEPLDEKEVVDCINERVQRCISDMADDFGRRSDEVALRIIDEVYKELSSEDKNVVEDIIRGRLKANELFNYIRDKLSYVIHTPDIGELISNAKLIVRQQSRANDTEVKGEEREYAKGAGCEAIRDINDTSDKLVNIICKLLKGKELEIANDMIKKEPYSNPIFTFIYKRVAYKVFNQDYGLDLEELTEDVRKFIRIHIKD
ncbi:hypothetical protein [uncultured Gammaproteobacteria bacterium]|nr:hypothetical protein [uncultured Gammaproteobacteria bacterium]CAC9657624.1 hypothetical protein [uncultured Gammaproteobacteria bacterium]